MSEIQIRGVIGQEVTAQAIEDQLAMADTNELLEVRFDSPGGSVLIGNTIRNAFARYEGPKRAIVDSFAGSIASYILTAFDDVQITRNGFVMIHNPTLESGGDDDDHERDSKWLRGIKSEMIDAYASRMNVDKASVATMMKAETFFGASEAVANGFATSVLDYSNPTQVPVSVLSNMPHSVVACLQPKAGENSTPSEQSPMAENQEPQAATVKEIKAKFPNMSAAFMLKCVEDEMPMASVASAAAEEMMAENDQLKAENEDLKAKLSAMEEEDAEAKAKAMEEEEAEAKAQAKATANQPVANAGGSGAVESARDRWANAVAAYTDKGMNRAKAVQVANKRNPGLREEMLAEVNR